MNFSFGIQAILESEVYLNIIFVWSQNDSLARSRAVNIKKVGSD